MDEIRLITKKYDERYIREVLFSIERINEFALTFLKDVAEIYDCITRIKNTQRNPTGFSENDAPILGLLVRIWKLLKEIAKYYENNQAEVIAILERPLIEASVMATYLLKSDISVVEDYRKCSYKDRLRILRDLESGSRFYDTKAGKRLLRSIRVKLNHDNFDIGDFDSQKSNRWRIQGKSFRDIFKEIESDDLYPSTYGMMSESIHGSWNESLDWDLTRNEDGTYSTYPFYIPADARFVTATIKFASRPFPLWLKRIDVEDESLLGILSWIERVNTVLFRKFDNLFDGP